MKRAFAGTPGALWLGLALVLAIALGGLALGLAQRPTPSPSASAVAAKPALWRIADGDTMIYLFGTIHALPYDVVWRTPAVERAIDSSDELLMEIADGDTVDELSMFAAMASDGAPPEPIAGRIDRNLSMALDKAIDHARLRRSQLDAMEDWAAALTIGNALGARAGFDTARGVEAALDARFRSVGKPVAGLETTAGQFAMFDTLPAATQNALLVKTIVGAGDNGALALALTRAWERGDVATIDRLVTRDLRSVDGLAGPLLDRRNARWADVLAKRLDRAGTVFVAVGAAHLAGRRSVQSRLADATGLSVERVQ